MTKGGGKVSTKAFSSREKALTRLMAWRDEGREVHATYVRGPTGRGAVFLDLKGVIVAVGEKFIRCHSDRGSFVAITAGADFFYGPMTAINVAENFKVEIDAVQINLVDGDRIVVSTQPLPKESIEKRRAIAAVGDGNDE